MKTDRELLELAAKAVGINLVAWKDEVIEHTPHTGGPAFQIGGHPADTWNPLTDDGDALRLMVKLGLTVKVMDDHVKVGWPGYVQWIGEECLPCDRGHMPTATRRAIVRAAAALAEAS